MWQYNNTPVISGYELYHYGILGMKWGRHRAQSMLRSNTRLTKKALNYDIKSDRLNRNSEKQHAKKDLESANKQAKKAANYSIKSEKLQKKANKATDELKKMKIEKRVAKFKYNSSKAKIAANRISKTKGYGLKAMRYSIKSDKVALKAAKARRKIANNKKYIAIMNRRMSTLNKDELKKVQTSIFEAPISDIKAKVDKLLNNNN